MAVQLADTATGETLWGERIDAEEREIFDLQDRVVAGIVAGIAPNLRAASLREALRKRPENLSAYDLTLQALYVLGTLDRTGFAKGRRLLERAMAEDPFFALPRAWAARWHSISIARGWSANTRDDADAAIALADRAIALDGSNALALATRGHISAYLRRDCDAAMENFRQALAAAPSNSVAWTLSSTTLSYLGRATEAVKHAERGLRLSPYDPLSFSQHFVLGLARYAADDLARAEGDCRMSLGAHAQHAATWKLMAAVLAGQGNRDAAAEAGARVVALEPSFRLGAYERDRLPIRNPALRLRIMRDLRQAGLPE